MAEVNALRWLSGALLGYCLIFCDLVAAKPKPLTAVADLRYGAALYQYYQNKQLEALSELMVAEKKGGIVGHGDNPELMQGGFYLAYGMERTAADVFERLLAANRSERIQNAAWLYLARLRYLRGDYAMADDAISRIGEEQTSKLSLELTVLKISLALRRGQLTEAEALYKNSEALTKSDWLPYIHYNLGAAYGRDGNFEASTAYYNRLLSIPQRSQEFLSLYDKAMTASGYSYLLNKQYPESVERFSKVRLDSPMSNPALLGYGWAATEMKEYETALQPWSVLSKRSLIDENTQEALIAIPFVYEQMGFLGRALEHYRSAEQNFTTEIGKLDDVLGSVKGYAIREALNIDRSEDFNWLNYAQSSKLSPQVTYLIELFSKDAFIGMVQELRDLLAIQVMMSEWREKLDFYAEMLTERDANRAVEMSALSGKALEPSLSEMERQREAFVDKLARIETNHTVEELLNPEEDEQYQLLMRAQKNWVLLNRARLQGIDIELSDEQIERFGWKIRVLKGNLIWLASEDFSDRVWRIKKQLAVFNETIEKNRGLQANVENIVELGFDLQPYRDRIEVASDTLLIQTVDVEIAIERAQDRLRSEVHTVLQQQRERLFHYMSLARLSVARLLDLAAKAQEPQQNLEPEAAPDEEAPVEAPENDAGGEA